MALQLTSRAFEAGGAIPRRFTCDGEDVSPPLEWRDAPTAAASFVLVVDDPDAPRATWVHWLLYDLPAGFVELPDGVPPDRQLGSGARQGVNDFRKVGYGGPCPPPGPAHRYFFRLYALDVKLGLRAGARRAELEQAMKGHVMDQAELMGRYGR